MAVFDAQREELVHLAGDQPDPMADRAGRDRARGMGIASTVRLNQNALGHPLIRWGDKVIEADVYLLPGEPMHIHIICPKCSAPGAPHGLTIKGDQKAIEYDPRAGDPKNGGLLNVEQFECTWELEPGRGVFSLCRWRVVIEKNIARNV